MAAIVGRRGKTFREEGLSIIIIIVSRKKERSNIHERDESRCREKEREKKREKKREKRREATSNVSS